VFRAAGRAICSALTALIILCRPVASAVALVALITPVAQASELDQFQNARAAYDSLNYELAADLFAGLLGDAAPGDRRPLVIESRKYLAASYLFMGRTADADRELRQLLEVEPDYVLDPLEFPAEVQRAFARVKAELDQKRAQDAVRRAEEEAASRHARERATAAERERLERLIELARTERTVETRSRWLAMIPFGVGQYQNGHEGLGLLLAVTESVLLAGSITAYAFHANLRGQQPAEGRFDDARLAEAASRYINQISFGLFAVVAITGVVDAQLRFQPTRVRTVERPLPPEIEELEQRPRVSLGAGPTPLSLSISGTF
jgi:hypothetical protein